MIKFTAKLFRNLSENTHSSEQKFSASPQPLPSSDRDNASVSLLIAPWGDHPHRLGIQRVDEESIRRILRSFHSLRGRLKRALIGKPIYLGHPDADPSVSQKPSLYGLIQDLFRSEDGLHARITLTEAGAELVRAGIRWLSPYWKAEPLEQKSSKGQSIYRPVEIISLGLTRSPNIRAQALTNQRVPLLPEGTDSHQFPMMKTSSLTQNLRSRYPESLRLIHTPEQIRALVNERRRSGQSYDEAFSCFFKS